MVSSGLLSAVAVVASQIRVMCIDNQEIQHNKYLKYLSKSRHISSINYYLNSSLESSSSIVLIKLVTGSFCNDYPICLV